MFCIPYVNQVTYFRLLSAAYRASSFIA
jgi:hypothetical protein